MFYKLRHYNEEEEGEYEICGVELPSQNYGNQIHCSQEFLQKSAATFLLCLKEKFKFTQVSLQGIIQGVTSKSKHLHFENTGR